MPRKKGSRGSRERRKQRRVDGSDEDVGGDSGREKQRPGYPIYVGGRYQRHHEGGHHHAAAASQLCDSPGVAIAVGLVALAVCSAICTYFLAKKVKDAIDDINDRRGEVLLVSSVGAFGQYQQLAKKGVTIIVPREGEKSIILHPDPREGGFYHKHFISNGELQGLEFPEAGYTPVLLSDQLSEKIDGRTGSKLLQENHRVNTARRGWGTLMGAAAGVAGTGAAVAAAAALSALALTPVGWAVLACAAVPVIALACAKVGRWMGSIFMDQPAPQESRLFRDASASQAQKPLLSHQTPTSEPA